MSRFSLGPVVGFTLLSLLGFAFFATMLILTWIYAANVNNYLMAKYKKIKLGEFVSQLARVDN